MTEQDVTAALLEFINSMQWSPDATDHEKTLVVGNLHGFAARLRTAIKQQPFPSIQVTLAPGTPQQIWVENQTTGGGYYVTVMQTNGQVNEKAGTSYQ